MKKIVIVGGGFAGAFAAKGLLKRLPHDCTITLINPVPFFTFKPLLHEVATGVFGSDVVCEPISSFLRHKNFEFIKGKATGIELKKQAVSVNKRAVPYDYLIMATGSGTNFFGIPGAEKYCFKLESLQDAFRIKDAILAVSGKQSPKILIAGGGPTGIEISTEISEFLSQLRKKDFSITVVNRSPVLLPQLRERSRKLVLKALSGKNIRLMSGTAVLEAGKNFVVTDKGGKIPADLIIWAAGVKPASIAVTPTMELPKGFFPVDSFLRLKGHENVFAVGDCSFAVNPDGSAIPQLAQSATEEGIFVAGNVLAALHGKPLREFVFRQKGFMLPFGKGRAVAEIGRLMFDGFFAWWLNRTIYLANMFTLSHKLYVAWNWTLGLFQKRDTKKL